MSESASNYIEFLHKICGQPGPAAQLRRTIGKEPHDALAAHRYVAPWLSSDPHPERESSYYTTAALYARFYHPEKKSSDSPFGTWLAKATLKSSISKDGIETRLHHLARLDGPAMRQRLHYLIGSVDSDTAPAIPWVNLLDDLCWWEHNPNIAKRWVQNYHRTANQPTTQTEEERPQ